MLKFLRGSVDKVRGALTKTRDALGLGRIFAGKIDEAALEQLEELFYEADLGVKTAGELVDHVRELMRQKAEASQFLPSIEKKLVEILEAKPNGFETAESGPTVALVIGVNGNGKTTSIAKLGRLFVGEGEKVIFGAGDTFRAAAIDQLGMWSERIGAEIVKHQPGSDPAAVAFDAVSAGVARGAHKVLIDTAGRLHTKTDLMQELAKIRRSCSKVAPGSPHETLLVLDATTGQNAIDQAKTFNEYTPISGIILTKLDGTARGGIVVAIQRELGIPVKFIGTGEGQDDLQPFNPADFVRSLLS